MGMTIYTKVKILETDYANYWYARKWCIKQFGPSKWTGAGTRPWYAKHRWVHRLRPSGYGQVQEAAFHFRDPAHATVFALTWAK
jgi:hypothetical protein